MASDFDLDDYLAGQGPKATSAPDVDDYLDGIGPKISTGAAAQLPGQVLTQSPPQISGLQRYPRMALSSVLHAAAVTAGLPGDLLQRFSNPETRNLLAGAAATDPSYAGPTQFPPTSLDLLDAAGKTGLTNRNDLTPGKGPYPQLERYGDAALEGLTSGAMMLPLGGEAAPMLASSVLGNMAGEAARQVLPGSTLAPIVAGSLAGFGASGVHSGLESLANTRNLKKAVADTSQAAADAQAKLDAIRLANPDNSAGIKSASQATRDAQIAQANAEHQALVTKSNLDAAGQQGLHLGAIEQVAEQHGPAVTLQDAGQVLQPAARDWLTNALPERQKSIWAPIDAAVPAETQVSREPLVQALKSQTTSAGSNQSIVSALTPTLPKRLLDMLEPQAPAGKAGVQKGLINPPSAVVAAPQTWSDAVALRSALGNAMTNPQIIKDIPAKQISQLYEAQTRAMRDAAASLPTAPGAGESWASPAALFDQANAEASRLHQLAAGPISKIISSANPTQESILPEAAASSLLAGGKKGATDLASLRQELPEGVNQLAAAALRQDGTWSKLSPEAQEALVPDASHRQLVADSLAGMQKADLDAKLAIENSKTQRAEAIKAANAAHTDTMDTAALQRQKTSIEAQLAARNTKSAARNASNALAVNQSTRPLTANNLRNTILTPQLGFALGGLAHSLAPGLSDLHGSQLGLLAGAIFPHVTQGTINAVRNPGMLRMPLAGGIGAANSLFPPPNQ